jgi:hypothetical protein
MTQRDRGLPSVHEPYHRPEPRPVPCVAETDSLAPSNTSGRNASPADPAADDTAADEVAQRRRRRRLWAQLLRRVYEVDPLTCRHCGGPMRVVAFIQEPVAAHSLAALGAAAPPRLRRLRVPIRKILAHLERHGGHRYPSRDPPVNLTTPARAAS